jgi:hypothetical protein
MKVAARAGGTGGGSPPLPLVKQSAKRGRVQTFWTRFVVTNWSGQQHDHLAKLVLPVVAPDTADGTNTAHLPGVQRGRAVLLRLPPGAARDLLDSGRGGVRVQEHVTSVAAGDTILVHGASGAVGVSVVQQAKLLGARVIGTASEQNFSGSVVDPSQSARCVDVLSGRRMLQRANAALGTS